MKVNDTEKITIQTIHMTAILNMQILITAHIKFSGLPALNF